MGALPLLQQGAVDPAGRQGGRVRPRAAAVFGLLASLCVGVSAAAQHNVLLIVADDIGVDKVGAYGEHPDPGHTPVIDGLAADGILFRNAWSNPTCSATRATLLTGRYSHRTGITMVLKQGMTEELAPDEVTIPKALGAAYRTAAVGKWHLGGGQGTGPAHPLVMGFEHHRGSLLNLAKTEAGYFSWEKNVDGIVSTSTTYATTDTVDEALALISQFSAPPETRPWFLWVAFNAAHKPYHHPPAHLHSFDLPAQVTDGPIFMKALAEAMDTEIGRLLSEMDPDVRANTVVVLVGDNGTNTVAVTSPFDPAHAKGSVFEGGVNVPLIVTGPGIVRGVECAGLANTTDIFATVMEIAGVPLVGYEDSVSLVPYFQNPGRPSLRRWVYAEVSSVPSSVPASFSRAVRGPRYKLMAEKPGAGLLQLSFYDLAADPFETANLLDGTLSDHEQAAYDDLLDLLEPQHATTWTSAGGGLAGSLGVPALVGTGSLAAGDPMALILTNVPPHTTATLVAGLSEIGAPFMGGVLVPSPDRVLAGLSTGASGRVELRSTWPPGVPSGLAILYQQWIADPAGPVGFSASNAMVGTVP